MDTEERERRQRDAGKLLQAIEAAAKRDGLPEGDPRKIKVPELTAAQKQDFVGLFADRRWMADDVPTITSWLQDTFVSNGNVTPTERALAYITIGILQRMAEATPGLTPVKSRKVTRDPFTGTITGISEGIVPAL